MGERTMTHLPRKARAALGFDATETPTVPDTGVSSLQTPRGKVWIKRPENSNRRFRRAALSGIARVLPIPILRPGASGKSRGTLLLQAQQSAVLKERGLRVAEVLYADPETLILADAGSSIERVVKALSKDPSREAVDEIDREALHAILLQMTQSLADLHREGLAHGRPKIRDFGWSRAGKPGDGRPAHGVVTILDLEERPWTVMPMEAAQARDILLWLIDLCAFDASRGIARGAMSVFDRTMSDGTRRELKRVTQLLAVAAPPARLISRTPLCSRELTGSLGAYDVLKEDFSK